ncbi:hydroxyisourate hydrolase [Agromyces sp. Leaf222]|uniref:hydroxyisourate hydrolase n=1 Tax=Agromyces sp. Leaf222 TaxID=1735688 RepID=UPI0006F7A592|nr:hydroxyisourate hydrolase [Agromyces sp. Leaf222]KQM82719.1 5-hydroxyisourate hydrolase [Agromyces sp. Leaf222]
MNASGITTHVLDTTAGRPAVGVAVELLARDADADADGVGVGDGWRLVATSVTDADGRVAQLGSEPLAAGEYRLRFDTGAYFAARSVDTFYPEVLITFVVAGGAHCHVPLLLSPFAYSTYRGS